MQRGFLRRLKSDIVSKKPNAQYTRPQSEVLTYAPEVLRHIYGGIQENEKWGRRCNFELHREYQDPNIATFIQVGRMRWIGHVERSKTIKIQPRH